METTALLRKLILACVDDERTLRHESKLVDSMHAETLTRLADARGQFVAELEELGAGREPHDGSWTELSREAGRHIWVTAAGRNPGDSISVCLHSRARTQAVYDEALKASWPDEILRVLTDQRRRIQADADELDGLQF